MRYVYLAVVAAIVAAIIGFELYGQATQQRVMSSNGNTMVIAYDAPNRNTACTEQVSGNPGFSSFILNQTSAVGKRSRTFVVVGLTPQLVYYYRTICGASTVSGQFQMNLPVPTPSGVLLGFTAAPATKLPNTSVDGIKFEWGLSPGVLSSSQSCTCTPNGCTVLIGDGSNIRQEATYYLKWSWLNGSTVLRSSEVLPFALGYGTAFPPATINYTSPRCLSPGSPAFTYSTGTAVSGWYDPTPAGLWGCGLYPTSAAPALPSAGCPTSVSFSATNQCQSGYSTPLIDTDTGNRIMRVTESGTFGNNTFSGSSKRFWPTSAGWAVRWNVNDTRFLVEGENFHFTIVGFNPASMTLTGTSIPLPFATVAPFQRSPNFSISDPDIVYYLQGNNLKSYNVATLAPAVTVLDFTTMPFWVSGQTPYAIFPGGPNMCGLTQLGTSGQNTGKSAFCYNLNTHESWVIDTLLGTINGQPLTGTTFTGVQSVHEVAPGLDGEYLAIDTGKSGASGAGNSGCNVGVVDSPLAQGVVQLRTGVTKKIGLQCDQTHWAMGHSGLMMQSVPDRPMLCTGQDSRGMAYRVFTDMNPVQFPLASGCFTDTGNGTAVHLSWQNDPQGVSANKTPVLVLAYNEGRGYQCLHCNEIAALSPAVVRGTATSTRFGQTWTTASNGSPAGCPNYDTASAQISRTGRFALFASDWLGLTGTGGTCAGGRRQDFFIMELK